MSNFKARGPIGWLIDAYRADPLRFFFGTLTAIVAIGFATLALAVFLMIRCVNQS